MSASQENKNSARIQELGFTLVELLVTVAVLGIIAIVILPMASCWMQGARFASIMGDFDLVRGQIELYEMETGQWPDTLEDAFPAGSAIPTTILYCTDDEDANNGHGNEDCFFYDPSNPSGKNNHGGIIGGGYLMRTIRDVAPCKNIDFIYTTCCGKEPSVQHMDDPPVKMGHPGQGAL